MLRGVDRAGCDKYRSCHSQDTELIISTAQLDKQAGVADTREGWGTPVVTYKQRDSHEILIDAEHTHGTREVY